MDKLFFVGSKLVWGMLSPSNLLVWLLLLATLLLMLNHVRAARRLLLLLSAVSFVIMAYPVGDWLMTPLEQRFVKPVALPANIDGIIVLGGGEQIKLSFAHGDAQLGEAGDRYLAAADLAKQYPHAPVIFTGGSGLVQFQRPDEQAWIPKQLFAEAGLAPARLIVESKSRNTYENFVNIKSLLPDPEGKYLLVTSAFHMPRAIGIARKQQIDAVAYPVDYRSSSGSYRQWDFDFLEHLKVLDSAWHEWLGLTAYYLTDKTADWFPAAAQPNKH